jgi:hypothetical protein
MYIAFLVIMTILANLSYSLISNLVKKPQNVIKTKTKQGKKGKRARTTFKVPKKKENNECPVCQKEDSPSCDWVQCDKCDVWYHM